MQPQPLDSILEGRRSRPDQLIETLLDIQQQYGYLSEASLRTVSDCLGVPLMDVYGVASFYKAFSLTPRGKNVITVCTGTACHVRGAQLNLNQAAGQLGVQPGEMTRDGLFTINHVNCLGACALGPVVTVNGSYQHHVTPGEVRKLIKSLSRDKMTEENLDD